MELALMLNLQWSRKHAAENYIRCTADAQVELYHNNAKKIETTANGASSNRKSSCFRWYWYRWYSVKLHKHL